MTAYSLVVQPLETPVELPGFRKNGWFAVPERDPVVNYLVDQVWNQPESPLAGRVARLSKAAYLYRETTTQMDIALKRQVLDEIEREPLINPAELGISVKNGVVSLTGFVDSISKKWAAGRVALRVPRVRAVANEIQVILIGSYQRTDVDIAHSIMDSIAWNGVIPRANDLQVTIENGWVWLDGHLDFEYQKDEVENIVQPMVGVKGFTNNISVKFEASPYAVREEIQAGLFNVALNAE